MPKQPITIQLEVPPEVAQEEVWSLEEQLKQVDGITTDLREAKDLITATLLFIHIVEPYVGQAVIIAGGIKATRDLARILYDFLHPKKQETNQQQGKNKVVIVTKRKRIELYNLPLEEIEKILEQ